MSIRVSTIILSYNRLDMLHRAIQSALQQTVKDQEVIVVDDCSNFDIHEALTGYLGRIRVMRTPVNMGCGGARNLGISVASGDHVAFLDDDDYWKPNKLERQLAMIGPHVMAACGQEFVPHTAFNVFPVTSITRKMLKQHNPVCGPSGFLCRRDLFEKVTFDPGLRYAEDWDFMLRVLDHGEIRYVPEPLIYYTVNTQGASLTSMGRGKSWDEIQYRFAAADKHRARMGEWNYRQRVATITLAHILDRPDRLTFIRHAMRKAGVAATGAALFRKVANKLNRLRGKAPQAAAG